ncbi:Uncharacterised protein [uncultured archaeon]|nr:Uncharacterised protein [uncultured archaeon]
MPDDLPLLSAEDEEKLKIGRLPFGGLFGNTVLLRVIREVIADPYREFRPKKLQILTSSSSPRIKTALDSLVSVGFMKNISVDAQRPVYKANLESKRLTALTLLAYAVTDDRDGTNCMDDEIRYYCNETFDEYYAALDASQTYNVSYVTNHIAYNIITPPDAVEQFDLVDLEPDIIQVT